MKACPNCKAENLFDGAQFCRECGAPLSEPQSGSKDTSQRQDQDDRLDFVVTEAGSPSVPDFLGVSDKKNEPESADDRIEIADTADLLSSDTEPMISPEGPGEALEPAYEVPAQDASTDAGEIERREQPEVTPPDWGTEADTQRLGPEGDIRSPKAPSGRETPQSPKESGLTAHQILSGRKNETGAVRPIVEPASDDPPSQKTHKMRGIAYFHSNLIQLAGKPFLHDGDEVIVNNKHYLLRPKRINKNILFGGLGAVLLIALVVFMSQFMTPTLSGDGEIVGLILDKNGKPYLEGARVSLVALDKSTTSNAQGFFRFELIPTGTYEVVYELGDRYIGQGNATVTAGQTTLMTFGDLRPRELAEKKSTESSVRPDRQSGPPTDDGGSTDKSSSARKSSSGYGKIKLQANVENARLTVDGKILGAGNNTYARIRSGRRTVKVSKAGYSTHTEIIDLERNQTITMRANLVRSSGEETAGLSSDEWIGLGNDALSSNDFETAIEDFSLAIEQSPGRMDAYQGRAEAYSASGKIDQAVNDYIRAGEINRISGIHAGANDAFSSALNHKPKNINALVGRAGALSDNGDYRAALDDYNRALDIDREFYPALFGAGQSYFRMGDHKKAEKSFEKAYDRNQSDPFLYQYMMLNYLARDNIKKLRKTYSEFKIVANPAELAEFKSSSRYEPVLRLIKEDDR
ncbi:MAG: tetratricopeptide repeat protein [Candidatus Zixiibacteriota bacterium]|nr:MAG: tetratricopeptide repeat protein [candidate division Zixibacteria bacterium]